MTPIQWRSRLRMMLDDEDTRFDKAGVFWDDIDLNRQLDASQLLVLERIANKGQYYLLQGLLSRYTVPLASRVVVAPLPNNYFLAVGSDMDNRPARLHMGGVGVVYEQYNHYGCAVQGSNVVFIGGIGKNGSLWYVRTPLSFSVQQGTDRQEFDELAYQAILYHTASTLMIKDSGATNRYAKLYQNTLTKLLQEPVEMHVMFDDAYVA